jgi:hypothetical protein
MIIKLAARGDYFNKMLRSPNKEFFVKKFGFHKASNAMIQSIDDTLAKSRIQGRKESDILKKIDEILDRTK